MKFSIAMISFASLGCLAVAASAQTVSSQYPTGQSYIISSSPTADGGVITTTYQPPQAGGVPARGTTVPAYQTSPTNPTVTQYRPLQANQVVNNYPATTPVVPTQFQTGVPQPATLPSNSNFAPLPGQTNVIPTQQPTSPIATHGTVQTVQSTNGVNPYVGLPLPTTANGRVVAYNNPGVNPCAPGTAIPANLPPSIGGMAGPQTVPVNQNYRPLLPIRGLPGGSYVSQGFWGNPRAYVQGQPVRNFWRYVIF